MKGRRWRRRMSMMRKSKRGGWKKARTKEGSREREGKGKKSLRRKWKAKEDQGRKKHKTRKNKREG